MKNDQFVQVKNEFLRKNLPPTAKLLQIVLISYLIDKDICFPSVGTLARLIGVSKNSIRKHLKILENRGFLEIIQQEGRPHLFRPIYGQVKMQKHGKAKQSTGSGKNTLLTLISLKEGGGNDSKL